MYNKSELLAVFFSGYIYEKVTYLFSIFLCRNERKQQVKINTK